MLIKMTTSEYKKLRQSIINIGQPGVTEVWNRIYSHKHTVVDANTVTLNAEEGDVLEFFGILERYSKSIGSLSVGGFKVTDIGKWKSLLTNLGTSIKNTFSKW